MQYWFEIGLAAMQQAMVDAALGEPQKAASLLTRPENAEETKQCNCQVHNNNHPFYIYKKTLFEG